MSTIYDHLIVLSAAPSAFVALLSRSAFRPSPRSSLFALRSSPFARRLSLVAARRLSLFARPLAFCCSSPFALCSSPRLSPDVSLIARRPSPVPFALCPSPFARHRQSATESLSPTPSPPPPRSTKRYPVKPSSPTPAPPTRPPSDLTPFRDVIRPDAPSLPSLSWPPSRRLAPIALVASLPSLSSPCSRRLDLCLFARRLAPRLSPVAFCSSLVASRSLPEKLCTRPGTNKRGGEFFHKRYHLRPLQYFSTNVTTATTASVTTTTALSEYARLAGARLVEGGGGCHGPCSRLSPSLPLSRSRPRSRRSVTLGGPGSRSFRLSVASSLGPLGRSASRSLRLSVAPPLGRSASRSLRLSVAPPLGRSPPAAFSAPRSAPRSPSSRRPPNVDPCQCRIHHRWPRRRLLRAPHSVASSLFGGRSDANAGSVTDGHVSVAPGLRRSWPCSRSLSVAPLTPSLSVALRRLVGPSSSLLSWSARRRHSCLCRSVALGPSLLVSVASPRRLARRLCSSLCTSPPCAVALLLAFLRIVLYTILTILFRSLTSGTHNLQLTALQENFCKSTTLLNPDKPVYVQRPHGFESKVCILHRALYGLKQSPLLWFKAFSEYLDHLDFQPIEGDPCVFQHGTGALPPEHNP